MSVSSVINVPFCSFIHGIILEGGGEVLCPCFLESVQGAWGRVQYLGRRQQKQKNEDALNAEGSY